MAEVTDKKVAVITTGGTIGAAFSAKGVTTLDHDSQKLQQEIDAIRQRRGLELTVFSPFSKFSEDMDPPDWARILAQIEECVKQGYKQIVVTHGTDTMAYSAMAASLYYSKRGIKICFTGAALPASAPDSDAPINLDAAFETVTSSQLVPNVYLAFRRAGPVVTGATIFRAQDIVPMGPDKNYFSGLYDLEVGHYSRETGLAVNRSFNGPEPIYIGSGAPTAAQLANPSAKVIQMPSYPGVSFKDLALDPNRENLVILGAYHSGTTLAERLRGELIELQKTHPKTKVVLGMHPAQLVGNPYETTARLAQEGLLTIYNDILPHQLYVLATCETAKGLKVNEALRPIDSWRAVVKPAPQS